MKKAIVVSKLNNTPALKALLKEEGFDFIVDAESSEIAEDFIKNNDFDLILINTPLENETGLELAVSCSKTTMACILVIVPESRLNDIAQMMTSNGIMIISKPISKHLFHHYMLFSESFKKRINRVVKENTKLKSQVETIKLVERAKLLLMQNLRMTESQAHHYLEKQAMDLRKSKYDVALRVLKTYEN